MGIPLPAHGGHDLDRQGWDTVWDNAESVLLALGIEDLEAGDGDDTSGEVVLLLESLDGVDGDADFRTGGHNGDVRLLGLVHDVTTLDGGRNGGVLELRKVLAGEGQDGGGVEGSEGDVVGGAGLVSVSWAPDHAVWQGAEVSESLDRLVGWSILTEADGVVGGDPDDTLAGESGQADGTGCVGDEVKEGSSVWEDGSVGGETVHDSSHGVLTDTISDVATAPVTKSSGWGLEVDGILPPCQVGTGQICGSSDQLWDSIVDLAKHDLGKLSRRNSSISWCVNGKVLLPSLGKGTGLATLEVSGLSTVLLGVLLQELVPLLLESGTLGALLGVLLVDSLGDNEGLLWVEAELLLNLDDIILLQWGTVDTTSSLKLRAEANGCAQLDHGWLVLDSLASLDGSLYRVQVMVSVTDGNSVPSVCLHTLVNILSEGTVGVTVNRDVVVIVNRNQVAQLQVTGHGSGLAGNTLHVASIAHEDICVVVNKLESGLVELRSSVLLGNSKTNGVSETLSERASGDLNAGGIVGFRVTGGDAVDVLESVKGVSGESGDLVSHTLKFFRSSIERGKPARWRRAY